ncbi:MAG: lysophospholipid acyltransferase family protein [Phycisphaeraceae bacterium]
MMRALRRRHPGASVWRIGFWHVLHLLCYVFFLPLYRYRAFGVRRIPDEGPLLIVSNHQSFYDPILVGLGAHRRQFYALARSGLFEHRGLAWLIRMLNAVPVRQGEGDRAAMKRCLEVLEQNQALLIFPEGSRTATGRTARFESGLMLLIKRARPHVLPVAVAGASDVWPRWRKRPRLTGRMGAIYGDAIEPDKLLAMKGDEALEHLRQQVQKLQDELEARL